MPKAILLVSSGPSHPDREDEYNEWYDGTHLGEVCQVPGIVGATRYTLHSGGFGPAPEDTPPYLAIYEIDADDLDAVAQEIAARGTDGRMFMSESLEMDPPPQTLLYLARD